jgi:tripartite-type tricarboxylate transporter receptor subunit TctC
MYCPTVSTYLRHSNELRALAVIDRQRDPLLPDVPAIYEIDIAEENKEVLEIYLDIWEIGRALITSPGVPPERVKFLDELFVKCLQDDEFLKTCKKMDLSVAPLKSEKVKSLVKSIMGLPQESIQKLKNVAYDKYR